MAGNAPRVNERCTSPPNVSSTSRCRRLNSSNSETSKPLNVPNMSIPPFQDGRVPKWDDRLDDGAAGDFKGVGTGCRRCLEKAGGSPTFSVDKETAMSTESTTCNITDL